MRRLIRLGWFSSAVTLFSVSALAVNCGDTITTNTTLTADLACVNSDGIHIGANNITLDLNGHTISCNSAMGYLGSCQYKQGVTPLAGYTGVLIANHNNVTVHGPGTITGFTIGVMDYSSQDNAILGLTITGPKPSIDFPVSERLLTVGVWLSLVNCQLGSAFAPAFSATVEFNDISQQTQGVRMERSNCALISGNNIHDNAGNVDSHGVDMISSSDNLVSSNYVVGNGSGNGGPDGGIFAWESPGNGDSAFNQIYNNYVTANCGDGIVLGNATHNNQITQNFAFNNPVTPACAGPAPAYDLANRGAGPGNLWNPNNSCKTEGPGIPAGVCP